VSFEQADLSSQREIRYLTDRISTSTLAVDVLVNNVAGVFERRRVSAEGIEYTVALNHLSSMLLTLKLEPSLRRSGQALVIQLAADPGVLARQLPDPDNLQMQHGYSGIRAYMRSKNMNVISSYRLARQFEGSRISNWSP
jgi:NAD(P)-dependent dehydrogenase (short-subunit alcohol dehydrogenase family)